MTTNTILRDRLTTSGSAAPAPARAIPAQAQPVTHRELRDRLVACMG